MPRYGVAAALVTNSRDSLEQLERTVLWQLAKDILPQMLNFVMLSPHPMGDLESVIFRQVPSGKLNPGKVGGQTSATGYFIAPNILSSQNVADIVKEAKKISSELENQDKQGNYELKKSFAPMIAKINAGKKSMSNPKIDVLKAAFTAVATLTNLKPAAFVKDKNDNFRNAGILPDIPFFDSATNSYPLIEYIELLSQIMAQGMGVDAYISKVEKGKYSRPKIFYGNYPYAPKTFGLGSVSLVTAIGKWVEEHYDLYGKASAVLNWLHSRPIYIVSYLGTQQERFGHHLVDLALHGDLYEITKTTNRVKLFGIPNETKFSNPKWQLFIRSFDHFLRFFDTSNWQNFLMYRATYPIEFFHLFKTYFKNMKDKNGNKKYSDSLIESAVAYGKYLNRAAYFAAEKQAKDDIKKGVKKGRTKEEYKQQYLLQFESIVGSAQNGAELMSRLNSQAGRITLYDPFSTVDLFVKEVVSEGITFQDAQHLVTAFMRLSSYDPNENIAAELARDETKNT